MLLLTIVDYNIHKSFGLLSTAVYAKFSGIWSHSLKVEGHRNKWNISYAVLLAPSGWKAVKRLPWVWSCSSQDVHKNSGKFRMLSADVTKVPWHAWPTSEKQLRHQKEEASEFCGSQEKLTWPQLPGASILTAIKLLPKQKEAAILADKIRHINLHYFLYSFTAIFNTNSLVSVSEAAHTWFVSLVKLTGLDVPGIESRSEIFRTRPDRT